MAALHELRSIGDVHSAAGGDPLLLWAAAGLARGTRAFSLGGATAVAAPDGIFGPLTDTATRRFQGCADIVVDGVIGAQTWSHLTFWASSPDFVC